MLTVVNEHMVDVRKCYLEQLSAEPKWSEELILDIAVKTTGMVSEVSIEPERVKNTPLGQCLIRTVPRWRFPEFTGETDEGLVQEVVNASFPFSFTSTER